jgi:hypothetical protein
VTWTAHLGGHSEREVEILAGHLRVSVSASDSVLSDDQLVQIATQQLWELGQPLSVPDAPAVPGYHELG